MQWETKLVALLYHRKWKWDILLYIFNTFNTIKYIQIYVNVDCIDIYNTYNAYIYLLYIFNIFDMIKYIQIYVNVYCIGIYNTYNTYIYYIISIIYY